MYITVLMGFMHTTSWTSASSFVSCRSLMDKLINPGVPDLSSHNNNNQTHLD